MASPDRGLRRGGSNGQSGGGSTFIRGVSRVAPSSRDGNDDSDDDDDDDDGYSLSSQNTKREPMRRQAWTAENGKKPKTAAEVDDWDFAERGPLAKLKTRQLTEIAQEKATMGVYVDDAELGLFKDATAAHLKRLQSDSDFIGPESYPRRQRDWVGYYLAFVMCFASFIIGTNAISNGKPGYLFSLVESTTGRLCGFDSGVTNKPYLWHPHAGEKEHGSGAELSVCVAKCPHARSWVCVDEDVANIFDEEESNSTDVEVEAVVYNSSIHTAPPPAPPPVPPSADCPSGVYLHSLLDFEPVFLACLPVDEDKQTIQEEDGSEGEGDGGGGEGEGGGGSDAGSSGTTTKPPRDMHFASSLKEVDTPERFIANAFFAEVDSCRWVLLVTLIVVIGLTFGLNAILNRDAGKYHSVALAGSILLSILCAALFGLKEFLNIDSLSSVMVDTLDDRLKMAKDVQMITPFLTVPFILIAVKLISHAINNKDQVGLGTTLLDVAGSVLSLAGFDITAPLFTIGPLLITMLWITVGSIYLSAVASMHFHNDRVELGGGIGKHNNTSTSSDGSSSTGYTEHQGWHGVYRGATVFHVLFCWWFSTFVILFVRCVVSSVVCSWYWARDNEREQKLSEMTTWRAVRRVLRCHAGSLALLAFWMPVMTVPRWVVNVSCKIRGLTGEKTPPYSVALAYRSAAVCQIALHGCSLKRACFNQHHLKMRNGEIVRKCANASDGVMFTGWVVCALASFSIAAAMSGVGTYTTHKILLALYCVVRVHPDGF